MWAATLVPGGKAAGQAGGGDPPISEGAGADAEYYQLLEVFVDALDQIERNYVKEVNRRELVEAAIQGMVGRLDPHSSYIPPRDVDAFRASV
ncbi:MAG: hypothetical protein GTO03_09015, partial [Planctomycetales bacterium]|nr:hypothetical protein [Planctomycetales bacterium]